MRDRKMSDSGVSPWHAGDMQTNAYIVWALVAAGERGLGDEIQALVELSKSDQTYGSDPYFLGLLSATLYEVHLFLLPSRWTRFRECDSA